MGIRSAPLVATVVALLLGACTTGSTGGDTTVQPIEDILASDITVDVDRSGTSARLLVETRVPVACAVVYGQNDDFGAIATDDDMAGGAHQDHSPRLTGLEPATEYRYVLQGSDAAGTLYRSEIRTFRTPEATVDAAPGPNLATDATVVEVSSEFSDAFDAGRAIDGDLSTEWSTDGDGDDASLTIELPTASGIVGSRWRTREMSDGSGVVHRYTVTVDGDETFGPFPVGDGDPVAEFQAQATRLRFDAVETTGGNTGAVEIEIYGQDVAAESDANDAG